MSDPAYHAGAELYDRVYADPGRDVDPIVARCRAAGGRVLEVCCGTGRLLLPTLAAGVACDGLDADEAMLDRLRAKLAARKQSALLVRADMRDFTLPHRYRLVVIGFNSFLHNLTQADQLATLRCCRAHLEPGGALVLGVFHPSLQHLLDSDRAELLAKEVDEPATGLRLRVWDRCETDRVEQVRRVFRRVEEVATDGTVRAEHAMRLDLRYVWKPETELLLRAAGFARWSVRSLDEATADGTPRTPEQPLGEGDMLLWTAWTD